MTRSIADMIDNERVVVECEKGVLAGIGELVMEIRIKEILYTVNERGVGGEKNIQENRGCRGYAKIGRALLPGLG